MPPGTGAEAVPEPRILTVGHANRAAGAFVELLRAHGVDTLVDVRRYPASRRFPWFEGDALRHRLGDEGIRYHFAGNALGGMRAPSPEDDAHPALEAPMRAYAVHMRTTAYKRAIARLVSLARHGTVALMCAERDPARCHRLLIADSLHFGGVHVVHIGDGGGAAPHRPHPAARPGVEGIVYDRSTQRRLL